VKVKSPSRTVVWLPDVPAVRRLTAGHDKIRKVYAELLAGRPSFSSAGQSPAIRNGDLALTSTRLP